MNKPYFSIAEIKKKLEFFCAYQDRCYQEVEKKLATYHLIPEAKNNILIDLIQDGFLNEERFAQSFARGKFRIKKWGKQRIICELKQRNISLPNIKIALKEIDDQEYILTLQRLIETKNKQLSETDFYKRKKKLINYLIYKGYESGLVLEKVTAFFL
ncbi:regulatory protein RecX [Tenacibaculum sp. UWU-22]|uniref:regulatory protein RecX n=1 Tax=Tenacibaculum sp. UWU-22 TaxID=3234187 RepID=UPI0034DAF8DA